MILLLGENHDNLRLYRKNSNHQVFPHAANYRQKHVTN